MSYGLPSQKARRQWLAASSILLALSLMVALLRLDPLEVIRQFYFVQRLAGEMWPPNLQLWLRPGLFDSLQTTFAMAVMGTGGGCLLALAAGLLGARNTSPHPAVRAAVRTALALERAITAFFILMILLVVFGLGPIAGTLTLMLSTAGLFGKIFADSIEQTDSAPIDAIAALGASRLQVITFGVLPQVLPSLVANSLYAFDVNMRTAIALGVFGAGGIGFDVSVANNMLRYRDVLGYAMLTVLLLTISERASDWVRRRLLTEQ